MTPEIAELADRAKRLVRRAWINSGEQRLQELSIGDVHIRRDSGVWSVIVTCGPVKAPLLAYVETPSGEILAPSSDYTIDHESALRGLLTLRQHMVLEDLSGV